MNPMLLIGAGLALTGRAALPGWIQGTNEKAPAEQAMLFNGRIEKVWATAESEATAQTNRASGAAALRWHVKVDHFGGEPKYPIGWPRVWRRFQGAERDWTGYDYLQFRVLADTSRDQLPQTPVTLLVRMDAAEGGWSRPLTGLKKGEWTNCAVPIGDLPQPAAVDQIMFSLSESEYRHQDDVTFTIADLALVRPTAPALLEFGPEQAVQFSDTTGVPVRFRVSGLKTGARAEVVCEMKRQGAAVSRVSVAAGRGPHRLLLKPGMERWAPDVYQVVGRIGETAPEMSQVRLVESPWNEGR